MQEDPPPYPEYASEINYLAGPGPSADDSGFYENARADAVRYLGQVDT